MSFATLKVILFVVFAVAVAAYIVLREDWHKRRCKDKTCILCYPDKRGKS